MFTAVTQRKMTMFPFFVETCILLTLPVNEEIRENSYEKTLTKPKKKIKIGVSSRIIKWASMPTHGIVLA